MNADLRRIRTAAETALLESFADVQESLPGNSAVHADRRLRMGLFEREGLPHRRVEQWKYTDLRTLVRELAPLADAADISDVPGPVVAGSHQIVIADGGVMSGLDNLPAGVSAEPLADALNAGTLSLAGDDTPDRAIDALNAAFVRDGLVVSIADGTTLDAPIELVFQRSGKATFSHARVVVVAGAGTKANIVERHTSPNGIASQATAVTQYELGQGALLDVLRMQNEGSDATHLGEFAINLAAEAEAKLLHIVAGGKTSRTETRATFAGEGARFDVAGITMVGDRQHSDLTLYVDHLVPHGESTETFKSVIDDAAKSIFQGKIVVAQDAQKTDAQMAINALLLSDTADMVSKPELEIFADDVSCAHGSTCGDIDEDLMFYLLARGIPTPQARKLLLQAFLSEGADLFEGHAYQEVAFEAIDAWLTVHAER